MSSPLYSGLLVSPTQYTFKREKAVQPWCDQVPTLKRGVLRVFFFGETSDTPELPPIYRKPLDTKKLSNTPLNFQFLSLRTLQGYNGYINIYICPLYPPLQNYAVLGSSKTTPFWAKRRSFAFFFFLKKEIKKKKEIGVAPSQKWGGRTTPFLAKGVAPTTPNGRYGVAEATPRP
jgi:hypothetical protein